MSAIVGPVAPYSNVPINAQYYQPSAFVISGVTRGITTTVTTDTDHNYVIGQQIRLIIPPEYGCRQLNEASGYVLSIPSSTSVVTSINSSKYVDPFISATASNQPFILAIGDINFGTSTFTIGAQPTVTGSFINISPE